MGGEAEQAMAAGKRVPVTVSLSGDTKSLVYFQDMLLALCTEMAEQIRVRWFASYFKCSLLVVADTRVVVTYHPLHSRPSFTR